MTLINHTIDLAERRAFLPCYIFQQDTQILCTPERGDQTRHTAYTTIAQGSRLVVAYYVDSFYYIMYLSSNFVIEFLTIFLSPPTSI
jgi:hypothetical protein